VWNLPGNRLTRSGYAGNIVVCGCAGICRELGHARDVFFALIFLLGSGASGPDSAPAAFTAPEVSVGSGAPSRLSPQPAPQHPQDPRQTGTSTEADAGDAVRTASARARALLDLINQTRSQAGLPALAWDDRLAQAAANHARIMAERGAMSHRFDDEPPLLDRLTAQNIRLDRASENVVYDLTVEGAHRNFMGSPAHRANLLDPGFDAAGVGVVEMGGVWYIVEDFAHRLTDVSDQQAAKLVEESFARLRRGAGAGDLPVLSDARLREAAQAMAFRETPDGKAALALPGALFAAAYATTDPATLPASVARLSGVRGVAAYGAGVYYARTTKYPAGLYWVTLVLFQSPEWKLAGVP